MPIFLQAPQYRAGGPDGRGWNRLSLNAHMGTPAPRCALRPRSHAALHTVARSVRLCEWGTHYAACDHAPRGDCGTCPRWNGRPRLLAVSRTCTRVMVRIYESAQVDHLIPGGVPAQLRICVREDGIDGDWHSASPWTWEEVTGLTDWRVGRRFADETGPGFWLERDAPADPDTDDDDDAAGAL